MDFALKLGVALLIEFGYAVALLKNNLGNLLSVRALIQQDIEGKI